MCECWRGDDAGHDTLVVAEEEEVGCCYCCDHFLETVAGGSPECGDAILVFAVALAHGCGWVVAGGKEIFKMVQYLRVFNLIEERVLGRGQ